MLNSQNFISMLQNRNQIHDFVAGSSGIMSIDFLNQLQITPINNQPDCQTKLHGSPISQKFITLQPFVAQSNAFKPQYFTQLRPPRFAHSHRLPETKSNIPIFNSEHKSCQRIESNRSAIFSAEKRLRKKVNSNSTSFANQTQFGFKAKQMRRKVLDYHQKINQLDKNNSEQLISKSSQKKYIINFQQQKIISIQQKFKNQFVRKQQASLSLTMLKGNRVKCKENMKKNQRNYSQERKSTKNSATTANINHFNNNHFNSNKRKRQNKIVTTSLDNQMINYTENKSLHSQNCANLNDLKSNISKQVRVQGEIAKQPCVSSIKRNDSKKQKICQLQRKERSLNQVFNKLQKIITQIESQVQNKQRQVKNTDNDILTLQKSGQKTDTMKLQIQCVLNLQISPKLKCQVKKEVVCGFNSFGLQDDKHEICKQPIKQHLFDIIPINNAQFQLQQDMKDCIMPIKNANQQQQSFNNLSRTLVINSSPFSNLKSYNRHSDSKLRSSRNSNIKQRSFMKVTMNENLKNKIQQSNQIQTIQTIESKTLSVAATKRGEISLKPRRKIVKESSEKSQSRVQSYVDRHKGGIRVLSNSGSKQPIRSLDKKYENQSQQKSVNSIKLSDGGHKVRSRKILITKAQSNFVRHIKQTGSQLRQCELTNRLTPSKKPNLQNSPVYLSKRSELNQQQTHCLQYKSNKKGADRIRHQDIDFSEQKNYQSKQNQQQTINPANFASSTFTKSIKIKPHKSNCQAIKAQSKYKTYSKVKTMNPTMFYQEKRILKPN